jgi:hypothetical protein
MGKRRRLSRPYSKTFVRSNAVADGPRAGESSTGAAVRSLDNSDRPISRGPGKYLLQVQHSGPSSTAGNPMICFYTLYDYLRARNGQTVTVRVLKKA